MSWRARTSPRRSQIAPRRKRAPRSSPSTSAASWTGSKNVAPYAGPLPSWSVSRTSPESSSDSSVTDTVGLEMPTRREISAREIGAPARIASSTVRSLRSRRSVGVALRANPLSAEGVEHVRDVLGAGAQPHAGAALRRVAGLDARDEAGRAPPSSAPQNRNASEPSSSITSTLASTPSSASSIASGRTPTITSVRPLARTPGSVSARPPNAAAPSSPTGRRQRFIAGEPTKPATNVLTGRSNSARGVSHCWSWASRSTATRWPSVIASAWSWVT